MSRDDSLKRGGAHGLRGMGPALLCAGWLASSLASPAYAYVRTRTTMSRMPMCWCSPEALTLNVITTTAPTGVTSELFLGASQAAANAWSTPMVACTRTRLQVVPQPDLTLRVAADGSNRVFFRREEWCNPDRLNDQGKVEKQCYDTSILALTSVFAKRDTGEIIDTDIEINGVSFRWGDRVANPQLGGREDLQNTLTHEFGHVLGLDHTCYLPGTEPGLDQNNRPAPSCQGLQDPAILETTMLASVIRGDIDRRTLAADDQAAICAVYPATKAPDCPCGSDGGCSVGGAGVAGRGNTSRAGTGTLFGALACALLTGLRARARRRRQGSASEKASR